MTKRSTFRRLGRNKAWPDWYRRLLVEARQADERAARRFQERKLPTQHPRLTIDRYGDIGVVVGR